MKVLRYFSGLLITCLTVSWSAGGVMGQYQYQEDQNKKVLKEAVLGAGVGAVSAGTSGGSAGKGALIGAGTNVIGSALLDTLTSSPQPQPQVQVAPQQVERVYQPVEVAPRHHAGGCGRRNR